MARCTKFWPTRPKKRANSASESESPPMFVIELQYKVELSQIDAHMKAHMSYLHKHYAAGTFVASGRKLPREGGIILAVGKSREQIESVAREDPFVARGLADVRVIEFRVSQRAPDLAALFAAEPSR
jgi:uncharacterized protein YciI